jgi:UPF0716 family protein affecting phage T7 exclusion
MSMAAALLLVPGSLVLVFALLLLVAWEETHVLSPRSMILWAVKVQNTPEHAEQMVAREIDRLLAEPGPR